MKELLPLGSVVTLHNGDKKVMIVGRIQMQSKNGPIYDYASVLWPEGMIDSSHFYLFNHEDISHLYYIGMQNEDEFAYRHELDERLKEIENLKN
jgi:hypothetical protein